MQRMTAAPDELALLRGRAYGPNADIHDDPRALARLRHLEDEERRAASHADAPVEVSDEEEDGTGPNAPTAAAPAAADVAADTTAPRRPPRRIPRAWLLAWAASVLVVAVSVGALVFSLASIRPVSEVTGATQVATLDQPLDTTGLDWFPEWFGPQSEVVSYEYLGLVVMRLPAGMYASEVECINVAIISRFTNNGSSVGYDGPTYYGCGAGPFPPTAPMVVDERAPDELRARFPDGTALSFVFDGERVGVFMGEPTPTPTPTPAPA